MTTFIDKFIYRDSKVEFNSRELCSYSLKRDIEIETQWNYRHQVQANIRKITCGLSYFFERPIISKLELKCRIRRYRIAVFKANLAARKIQIVYTRNKNRKALISEKGMMKYQASQVSSLTVLNIISVPLTWLKSREINFFTGARGQIVWSKMNNLIQDLKMQGFHTFIHAHSFPISLHLEMTTYLRSMNHSKKYLDSTPTASLIKFRAPGVATPFKNTTDYLNSPLGKSINNYISSDDENRATIISCDALCTNKQPYESAHHFFTANKSIADDPKSFTGMSSDTFDTSFLRGFLKNNYFLEFAKSLFKSARQEIKDFPSYGMVRIIAIKKETLENEKTNYIWRSHPFGRICTCRHAEGKYGHAEFVTTLNSHQNGNVKACKNKSGSLPQYRILAANLDRDPQKLIYSMDCLDESQKLIYRKVIAKLTGKIQHLVRLEELSECNSYENLKNALREIRLMEKSYNYWTGVRQTLEHNRTLINEHLSYLKDDLTPQKFQSIKSLL